MVKRLVIIPARSGSKRILNKNIKLFLKKPLIYYCLEELKKSKLFNKIHISTDSKKISKLVAKKNVKFDFLRPKKLSGNNVGLWPVMKYVLERFKKKSIFFDQVWLVYATNPLINKDLILKCEKEFTKKSKKENTALITVSKYNYPIEWAQTIDKNGFLKAINKKKLKIRSQDLKNNLCDAGMINIYKPDAFLKKNKIINYIPYLIPYLKTVDIDDLEDFKMAEKLFIIND
jgi:CMP-N-acetylneuraminic acid synthetase